MSFRRTIRHFLTVAFVAVALVNASVGGQPPGGGHMRPYGAREVAAWADMVAMRDAEVMAYLDTGYLYSLEDLNDLLGSQTNYYFDDIMNGGGAQTISLRTGRFLPQRLDVRRPAHVWLGPYVTYQQGHFSIDGADYDPGTPLDPWGNPYYLFTPLGLVRPTLGDITLELYADNFDRYAMVCFASDGVMSSDDLILLFEGSVFGPPSVTTISSLRPAAAGPGQRITVCGYNFGATQGTSRLELAGQPLTPVSWSDRAIVFDVPPGAMGGEVVVIRGAERSNAFLFRVLVRARHWSLYQ